MSANDKLTVEELDVWKHEAKLPLVAQMAEQLADTMRSLATMTTLADQYEEEKNDLEEILEKSMRENQILDDSVTHFKKAYEKQKNENERLKKYQGENGVAYIAWNEYELLKSENERLREALQDFRYQAWNSLDPHTWKLNFQKADEALSNKESDNEK